jgi:hypothetical protein
MKKLITILMVVATMVIGTVGANAAVTLNFTEVDLGGSSQVDLTNQFAAYGVNFDHVYRYIDDRDPWPEIGGSGYGIDNGWVGDNYQSSVIGTVLFTQSTPYVTIDWWTITGQIHVQVYDAGNNLIDSFVGQGSGTETLSGGQISYLTFNDSGGFEQIANMTFETAAVPVPGAILLGGIGVSIVGWLRRRRAL